MFVTEIEELPAPIQEQLFSELLDRDAQQTLEADPPLINWSLELTVRLGMYQPGVQEFVSKDLFKNLDSLSKSVLHGHELNVNIERMEYLCNSV